MPTRICAILRRRGEVLTELPQYAAVSIVLLLGGRGPVALPAVRCAASETIWRPRSATTAGVLTYLALGWQAVSQARSRLQAPCTQHSHSELYFVKQTYCRVCRTCATPAER